MKIGLIGINMYPKYLNFACGLHTYAFQQFLLQHDIDNTVIDYKPVYFGNFDMRHPSDSYKEEYLRVEKMHVDTLDAKEAKVEKLEELQTKIDDWDALYTERENRYDKFQKFINDKYIRTSEKYDSDLLEVQDPGFDCYICVTDVIWNLLPTHMYDRGFFLASRAMDGKQKISYAASRGVPKPYTDNAKDLFFHYIDDIEDISVREESLKEFIEDNSEKEAKLVLDPVLLHDKVFWQKISVKPKEERYILLYYVMEKATQTIVRAVEYAKKYDIQIIEMSDRPVKNGRVNDENVKHIAKYDVSMEEWLGYIEHAECIFTNSFHGCCFSIIFEKIFYVGFRMGDKVSNFLKMFGLQSRMMPKKKNKSNEKFSITTKKTLKKRIRDILKYIKPRMRKKTVYGKEFLSMPTLIDYTSVEKRLAVWKMASTDFILNAIQSAESRMRDGITKNEQSYEDYRKQLTYPVNYHSGKPGTSNTYDPTQSGYSMKSFPSGNSEYSRCGDLYQNNGSSCFEKNQFALVGHKFMGWNVRIKIDNRWFWYMKDASLMCTDNIDFDENDRMLFEDGVAIPYISVNRIRIMVAEAKWQKC